MIDYTALVSNMHSHVILTFQVVAALFQVATCCYTGLARNPKISLYASPSGNLTEPNIYLVNCTVVGTTVSRIIKINSSNLDNSCNIYTSINGTSVMFEEDGLCPDGQLFNMDLCECWSRRTVELKTCRTRSGFDVDSLKEQLLKRRNITKVFKVQRCNSDDGSGLNRTLTYDINNKDLCQQEFVITWQREEGKLVIRRHRCKETELLNLDTCGCTDSEAVNRSTCQTKPGYSINKLRSQQHKQYPWHSVIKTGFA